MLPSGFGRPALLLLIAVSFLAAPAPAVAGEWIPVGFDDPRGYTASGFLACLVSGDPKEAFLRVKDGVGSYKEFAGMVKSTPALRDIKSFELVRVTAGGGTATLEARTKDADGRSFPVTLRLSQSPGSDEGWTIAAITTSSASFPAGDGQEARQPNR